MSMRERWANRSKMSQERKNQGGVLLYVGVPLALVALSIVYRDSISPPSPDNTEPVPGSDSLPLDEVDELPNKDLPSHLQILTDPDELSKMLTQSAADFVPVLPGHLEDMTTSEGIEEIQEESEQSATATSQEVAPTEAAPTPLPTENAPAESMVEESQPESKEIEPGAVVPLVFTTQDSQQAGDPTPENQPASSTLIPLELEEPAKGFFQFDSVEDMRKLILPTIGTIFGGTALLGFLLNWLQNRGKGPTYQVISTGKVEVIPGHNKQVSQELPQQAPTQKRRRGRPIESLDPTNALHKRAPVKRIPVSNRQRGVQARSSVFEYQVTSDAEGRQKNRNARVQQEIRQTDNDNIRQKQIRKYKPKKPRTYKPIDQSRRP